MAELSNRGKFTAAATSLANTRPADCASNTDSAAIGSNPANIAARACSNECMPISDELPIKGHVN